MSLDDHADTLESIHTPVTPGVQRLFALDGLGSLPRLFTTAVFLVVAVLAGLAGRRAVGRVRVWWWLVAGGAVALAAAKAVSVHSALERDDGRALTLAGGVGLTVVGLSMLLWTGLRRSVPGLDQPTAAVTSVTRSRVLAAFAVFLEEGGEAVAALALLAAVVAAAGAGVSRRGW